MNSPIRTVTTLWAECQRNHGPIAGRARHLPLL